MKEGMMDSKNLGGILDKINELRALFIFGQRVIPFLEELFYFVNDIVPVLEEVNLSIYETTSKMPHASSQLNKVSKANELATTEILDNLDRVLSRLNTIDSHFQAATNDLAAMDALDKKTVETVRTAMNHGNKELLQEVVSLHEKKEKHLDAVRKNAEKLENNLRDIRAKSNDIMISLQVQDITAQQIASVNHLIKSVQERLSSLIDRFKLSGAELITEIKKAENNSFDPNATYDRSTVRQKAADEIMKDAQTLKSKLETIRDDVSTKGTRLDNPTSQDEIDRLFGKGV
jgi:chemotaxis regulatin CheY-phosphate phosphatase CheZ